MLSSAVELPGGAFGSIIAWLSARSEPARWFTRSRVSAMVCGGRSTPDGTPLITPTSVSLPTNTSCTKLACPRSWVRSAHGLLASCPRSPKRMKQKREGLGRFRSTWCSCTSITKG